MFKKIKNKNKKKSVKKKNPPANAGDRFEPWSGKIPHAAEQLSPPATNTEAHAPRACAPQQEKPPQ